DAGLQPRGGDGDARQYAAAADGDDDGVEIGEIRQQLQPDGALARDDQGVVGGVGEGEILRCGALAGEDGGGIDAVALQQHPGAEAGGALDLVEGRALGHDDGG